MCSRSASWRTEILHALGFSARNFHTRMMLDGAVAVRGKKAGPVIKSPMVLAQARAQYGCTTQAFLELEDMSGEGTAYSHWKRRSMKDDVMALVSGANVYSALTIAAKKKKCAA
ncbi:Leishmanolysin [Novymonas esmeraldas]|uniref:Leishmanolysin-like peptidase n=1 Tax=Novymonas esmeraldas TaxID=1808958 RepID=A0AAW0EQU3_9TRYP